MAKGFQKNSVFVVGAGYVGLTTGVALAYMGHQVICMDIDTKKINALKQGHSPIHEPHLEPLLQSPNLAFTADLAAASKAEVIMICVGTPPLKDGQANLAHVESAISRLGCILESNRDYLIVVKSTVPVGTAQRVESLLKIELSSRKVHTQVQVTSNPEFLREGFALHDTFYPDRIVVGTNQDHAAEKLRRLYHPLLEQTFPSPPQLPRPKTFSPPPFVLVDSASSEMIKYAANAFLATKISFINEMAGLCEKVGADVREIARGIGLDKRIGQGFLQAGIGWGGSCFGKDTQALLRISEYYNHKMPLLKATRDVNYRQRMWIIDKLQEFLKTLQGRRIGVLGLAFKPDTDDVRDAPSLEILQRLYARGTHLQAHDPAAIANATAALGIQEIRFMQTPEEVFQKAHAVILLTEWSGYRNLPFKDLLAEMEFPLIIDGRNHLNHMALRACGYKVIGVGYPCES